MQYSQTRYSDTLSTGISNSALSLTVASTPPTRTQGILTLGRQQSNTEDVYYTSVAGNVVTIALRGLSQTALTLTTVAGNQKVHNANESVEMTTHHAYDVNKVRIDENETISGVKTFSGNANVFSGNNNSFTGTGNSFSNAVKMPGINDSNGNEVLETPATSSAVNQLRLANSATGNPVILSARGDDTNISVEIQGKGTGVLTIPDGSLTKTSAAPSSNAMIANKKYVDDQIAALGIATLTLTAGENLTANDALYLKASDGKVYKTAPSSGIAEATEGFIGFASSTVSINNSVVVKVGPLITGLSGLTAGSTYFLGNTAGALVAGSTANYQKPVLIATSSTTGILVNSLVTRNVTLPSGTTLAPGISATSTDVITCSFRPKRIEIQATITASDSASGNTRKRTYFATYALSSSGTAMTLQGYSYIGVSGSTVEQASSNGGAIEVDAAAGANTSKIVFTIPTVTETTFTAQAANVITNGTGSANVSMGDVVYKVYQT